VPQLSGLVQVFAEKETAAVTGRRFAIMAGNDYGLIS
jgi:hypothetical protein